MFDLILGDLVVGFCHFLSFLKTDYIKHLFAGHYSFRFNNGNSWPSSTDRIWPSAYYKGEPTSVSESTSFVQLKCSFKKLVKSSSPECRNFMILACILLRTCKCACKNIFICIHACQGYICKISFLNRYRGKGVHMQIAGALGAQRHIPTFQENFVVLCITMVFMQKVASLLRDFVSVLLVCEPMCKEKCSSERILFLNINFKLLIDIVH